MVWALFLKSFQFDMYSSNNQRHSKARSKTNSRTLCTAVAKLGLPDSLEELMLQSGFDVGSMDICEFHENNWSRLKALRVDKECQANLYVDKSVEDSITTTTIKYINLDSDTCDVEIQTDIFISDVPKVVNSQSEEFQGLESKTSQKCFSGFSSIKNDENMLELAGVSLSSFQFLLDSFEDLHKWKIKKENRLLIFLMKLKTGMTFCAIGVLFSLHKTAVSEIFFSLLKALCEATIDLVPWLNRDIVQSTMPKCFTKDLPNTRAVIDCVEFRIETPSTIDQRINSYSHDKQGFTTKALISITPCGFISFKSRVEGGRKSDSRVIIDSGFVELLEDGDVVLANKSFSAVKETMDKLGKKSVIVTPSFLEKKERLTKGESQSTYEVAKERVHIERIRQRLRTYRVLDKIPEHLLARIDDILHMCCVLVNLQSPILP